MTYYKTRQAGVGCESAMEIMITKAQAISKFTTMMSQMHTHTLPADHTCADRLAYCSRQWQW